ncbi:MAG: hypothetical protein RL701_187, partial [Pseudomonadota bacterium]
ARNSHPVRAHDLLLGRERELAQLEAAFAQARAGELAQVFVSGPSGMGKSALLRHFLQSAEADAGALVLSSRCYEREELPYKAFDPLVDALSSYLLALDETTCSALLPEQIASLSAVFGTLRRVPAIEARARAHAEDRTLLERRTLAADALYELCRRISQRQPLILYIDDLQWGDLDSVAFFTRFQQGHTASLLLLCAYRSEDHARSPLLAALRGSQVERPVVDIKLDVLTQPAATQLARALLSKDDDQAGVVEQIVREAAGSPFFVCELANYVRKQSGRNAPDDLRLERVVSARLDALSSECRLMLDLVVVAGRPERRSVLEAAANLGAHSFGALHTLEQQNLLQSGGVGANARVEPYHDRIRETAYGALSSERRLELHRKLAEVLQQAAASENEAEALFRHWKAAGERARACSHALVAAENAERSLAFSRAAALYAEAAQLVEPLDASAEVRICDLHERRARALTLSGRSADAARSFAEAADHCDGDRAKGLRVRSHVELLRSGHMDAALEGLAKHHETTGVALPKSDLVAVGMLLWRRLKIRLSRRPQLRSDEQVPSALAAQVERLWEISTALSSVDFLRGNLYTSELTLRALQAGGTRQLAFAYAMECIAAAAEGRQHDYEDYAARAIATSDAVTDPYALATVRGSVGVARFLRGDWAPARELMQDSAKRHRKNPAGSWDLATMTFWDFAAATQLGDLTELVHQVPEAARDADNRGDLFAAIYFRSMRSTWAWLAPDQPAAAREQLRIAQLHLTARGYLLPHYYLTLAHGELDLYLGTPQTSLARVDKEWAGGKLLRTIEHSRGELLVLRARLCIEQARQRFEPKLLRQARSDVRTLARIPAPWAIAHATLLQASLASADARPKAVTLLESAEQHFAAVGMKLHAAAAQLRRGQLLGHAEGAALQARAEVTIRACGVVQPAGFVRMLAPGLGYGS